MIHQNICDDLKTLTYDGWIRSDELKCKIGEFSPVISNMLETAAAHNIRLGNEFYDFLNYLARFSKETYEKRKETRRQLPAAKEPTEQQKLLSDNYHVSGQFYPAPMVRIRPKYKTDPDPDCETPKNKSEEYGFTPCEKDFPGKRDSTGIYVCAFFLLLEGNSNRNVSKQY